MADRVMQDRVQPAPPDSGHDLYIFSNFEKNGWRARVPGDQIRAPHPGSAIDYQDQIYEVMAIEPALNTPYATRYALRAWQEQFHIRQVFQYSPEVAREANRKIVEDHRQVRQHRGAMVWFALTGMLPTPVATRWQVEWNLPMRACAFISLFVVSAVASTVGPLLQGEAKHELLLKFMMFLVFEQVVRFFWLLGTNEAVGSLTVTAIWMAFMILTGREADGSGGGHRVSDMESQRDEVRMMARGEDATGPWDVEVRSMLRDPVLVGPSPVRYDGEVYSPLGYVQEGEGIRRRYVFRLKKLDPKTASRREYFPLRTAEQLRPLVSYERKRERVDAIAFFCGLLPYERQLALERTYDFSAGLWSQRTAKTIGIAAAAQLFSLRGVHFGLPHIVAIYFIVESVYRSFVVYQRGDASGSLLGWVLTPFLPK